MSSGHLIASSPSSSNPLNLLLVNLKTKKRPAARAATPATTLIPMMAPVERPDEPAAAAVDEAEAAFETEAVLMMVTSPPAELVDCTAVVEDASAVVLVASAVVVTGAEVLEIDVADAEDETDVLLETTVDETAVEETTEEEAEVVLEVTTDEVVEDVTASAELAEELVVTPAGTVAEVVEA